MLLTWIQLLKLSMQERPELPEYEVDDKRHSAEVVVAFFLEMASGKPIQ